MHRNDAEQLLGDLAEAGRLHACRTLVSATPNVLRYVPPSPFRSFTFVVAGDVRRCFSAGGPDVEAVADLDSLRDVETLFGADWEVLHWIATELESPVRDEQLTRATWERERQETLNREVEKVVAEAARSRGASPDRSMSPMSLQRRAGVGLTIRVDYDKSLRTQALLKSLGCTWDPLLGVWNATEEGVARVEVLFRAWAAAESRAVVTPSDAPSAAAGRAAPPRPGRERKPVAGVARTGLDRVEEAEATPRLLLEALAEAGWHYEHSATTGLLWVFPKATTNHGATEPEKRPRYPGVRFTWKGARRRGKAGGWWTQLAGQF